MKPNFALSLSQDTIQLLHRAATGWRLVGDAQTGSLRLAEDLAALRAQAVEIDAELQHCKIVIPNDQIRYLTIPACGADIAATRIAAEAALEDATPYAASELVYDLQEDGGSVHVAAVAHETLAEAEAFATEHGFIPVSFVARPEGVGFTDEPYFGETRSAHETLEPGDAVERDRIPLPAPDALETAQAAPVEAQDHPQDTEEQSDPVDDEVPGPGFVSRRQVPTFRTEPDTPPTPEDFTGAADGIVPSFGEPAPPGQETPSPAKPALVPRPPPTADPGGTNGCCCKQAAYRS